MGKKRILIICGPTATGKTALAIKLAKKFSGEIISADSRQVYRDMDIGTGKDVYSSKFKVQSSKLEKKNFQIGYYEINGGKVWLYDVVKPDYQFNVADYVRCANLVIRDIRKRGKLPILVGGTGFYIKAVTEGIETMGAEPDWELRKRLRGKDTKTLREMLGKLDVERLKRMNESDRSNPRRLIRAIEFLKMQRGKDTKMQSGKDTKMQSGGLIYDDLLMLGLTASNEILYKRIDKHVDERVKMGVEDEIRGLIKKGYGFENSILRTTIGYKEWEPRISNIQYPISGIIQRWQFDEHGYARRQMTWFKKVPNVHWFDIIKPDYKKKVETLVRQWYDK